MSAQSGPCASGFCAVIIRNREISIVVVAFVAAIALVPMLAGPFVLQLANLGGFMAIAAMALTVLTGTAGLLSLGHAAFLGIGSFSAAVLATQFGWPIISTLIAAALCGMAVGAIVALATMRTSGLYLAVGTFALQSVITLFLVDLEVKMTNAVGFLMPKVTLFGSMTFGLVQWWYLIASLILITYLFLKWEIVSHVGREWICARDNPTVAVAMGVSLLRARTSVFVLTSFITSFCGALMAYYVGIVQAATFDLHLSIKYITIVVLGGLGSLWGAIVAAYAIMILPHLLSHGLRWAGADPASTATGSESIALGIILIAVLLRLPSALHLLFPSTSSRKSVP